MGAFFTVYYFIKALMIAKAAPDKTIKPTSTRQRILAIGFVPLCFLFLFDIY